MAFITLTKHDFTYDKVSVISVNTDHIVQIEPVTIIGTRETGAMLTLSIKDKVGTSHTITVSETHPEIIKELARIGS